MTIIILGPVGSGKRKIADAVRQSLGEMDSNSSVINIIDENVRDIPYGDHLIVKCTYMWWKLELSHRVIHSVMRGD